MSEWWESKPAERYWCEVTDREDLGSNLHAPTVDQGGQPYWSYSLIKQVQPGDVVFHYYTPQKAFVAASVAGGPLREHSIVWQPHGTAGRSRAFEDARPSWLRPLNAFVPAENPLTLKELDTPEETAWLKEFINQVEKSGHAPRLPFQIRRDGLRGGQGYLFKLPAAAVERWPALRKLSEQLEDAAERSTAPVLPQVQQSTAEPNRPQEFRPKSDADYVAFVKSGVQHRTRSHERLVRFAGEIWQERGAEVSTPHPLDLLVTKPHRVIVEAKTTRTIDALLAVRAAVGQLHEYRYFAGPKDASLAILLDAPPASALVEYVENHLALYLFWRDQHTLRGGPRTSKELKDLLPP